MNKVTVTTSTGKTLDEEFVQIEALMDEQRIFITRYVYKEIDKAIIEHMPIHQLEVLARQTKEELKRRRR